VSVHYVAPRGHYPLALRLFLPESWVADAVVVGAGNAHLVFIRRWRMQPVPGVAVALVNEAPAVPYSAMVPAHITGDYGRDEATIDLVRLCRSAGVRLVSDRVAGLDPVARHVLFAD
jgi:selenide,water dikinase